MKLLIVDDEKSVRKILENMVKDWGYELLFAVDAVSAWEIINIIQEPIIILLDWILPGMSGIELCQKLKNNQSMAHHYVIMLTGMKTSIDDVVKGFGAGVDDFLMKPVEPRELNCRLAVGKRILTYQYELEQRNHALQETTEIMEKVLKQLNHANLQLKELSLIDELTGIANRRHLNVFFENSWLEALRKEQRLVVLMVDIDYFKQYNDAYGHYGGDTCLKQIAQTLAECVPDANNLVARYGGDEFFVVLVDSEEDGRQTARKIEQKIAALAIPHRGSPLGTVTVSIGIAVTVPEKGVSCESFLEQADYALYQAKEKGRKQWIAFQSERRNHRDQ